MANPLTNYSQNGTLTMFSDGPETLSNTNYQTLLKYMSGGTEQYMPQNTTMNLGMYHNNQSGSSMIFGFVVYNEGTSDVTVKNERYTVRTAPSVDANSAGGKLDMSTVLESEFLNNKVSTTTTTIPANSKKFIMSCTLPTKTLVIGRAYVKTSGNKCKIRAVCGSSTNAASLVNNFWTTTETNCASGQFSGVVNYSQKKHNVDYNSIKSFKLFSVANNTTEFSNTIYAKTGGKSYFAGNYATIYSITFNNIANKTLTITPSWYNSVSNPYGPTTARLVLQNPNLSTASSWFTTTRLNGSGSWSTPLGSSNSTTLQFLLPGANCGDVNFTIS